MQRVNYDPNHPSSFDREWGLHQGCNEWWYCTGTLRTEEGLDFSYQFTLVEVGSLPVVSPNVIMIALTDMQTGQHRYMQNMRLFKHQMTIEEDRLQFDTRAKLNKTAEGIDLKLNHKSFSLDLHLDYGKGAFWHCDKGKLFMGSEGNPRNTTLYFSYPNMPTTGWLDLDGRKHKVDGKTWFDKQGGTFNMVDPRTHWEWFSLRFYDDEEMMLFAFPRMAYYDGTYIDKEGKGARLNHYEIKTLRTITHSGKKWSAGWELTVPGLKDEHYWITPIHEGNINFAYFEELCTIKNGRGEQVGLCFVELLPGVHNKSNLSDGPKLFKNIEF